MPVLGFGAARFLLASFVAASHLWVDMTQGYAAYAVWAFFVLSGFLMTLILTTKYGFDGVGLRSYAFNRFMRIFPLYWIAVIMGLCTLLYYGGIGIDLRSLNGEFYMPSGTENWSHVITLFPGFSHNGLPVPVSNALSIEVGYYLLLPMLATSRGAAVFGLVFGGLINLKIGVSLETFATRYATFLPCLLPFAVGALICHFRTELQRFSMPKISSGAWLVHGALWHVFPSWPWNWGIYLSLLLSAWCVVSLYRQSTGKLDRSLGDMSYPIYLIHTTVAAWFVCACGINREFSFFVIAFAATLIISWLIVILVDRPLSRFKLSPPSKVSSPH